MRIGLLGPLEVRNDDGAAVEITGARLRTLLSALALEPGRVVSAGQLVDAVWGTRPPATANALQALVSRLRRIGTRLDSTPSGYRLPEATVDAARFEELVTASRTASDEKRVVLLREALNLWRGPALGDVSDAQFFQGHIARLNELRLSATEEYAEAAIRLGHGADLTEELSKLLSEHPLRERLAASLMLSLQAAGRPAEALQVFTRIRMALADELGADPAAELSAAHTKILRETVSDEDVARTNLRAGLTSFVGRNTEVTRVAKLVGEYRLTTLTGPGGAGKTRLATETGRHLLTGRGGVWFAELASVTNGADVAQAVLDALGLREQMYTGSRASGTPRERATRALRNRDALLVLDNCEHVIEAAAELADHLLGECPRLRILATSREPLALTGEALWPVEPLTLPAEGATSVEAMSCASVRLLADRAAAVRPGFAVDESTVDEVVRICRALDGMPLAVELAAARLRSMSVSQLAARLDDRFRLLTAGSRTALPRHRTLRAVVDWSWDLLEPEERRLLRRLSVFSGGATADAAEAVCGGTPELLSALVDKSLLAVSEDAEPRYRMLETIKAYGLEQLTVADEREELRQAHAEWFASFAETGDKYLRRAEQIEWLARFAAEHGNLMSAVRGAIAAGEATTALRLATSCAWFWMLTGHKTEAQEVIEAALALPGEVDRELRAMGYAMAALLLTIGMSSETSADELGRKALELSRDSQNSLLRSIIPVFTQSGDTSAMKSTLDKLLSDEDPWLRAHARLHRARAQLNLRHDSAAQEADTREAVRLFRQSGERWGLSLALNSLAEVVSRRGELEEAVSCYEESIQVVSEIGSAEDVLFARGRQAHLFWQLGDTAAAKAAAAAAERDARTVPFPDSLAFLAHTKADLARWRGDLAEARVELNRAEALLSESEPHPLFRAMIHHSHAYLDAQLGDLPTARNRRREALALADASGEVLYLSIVLVGIADHAVRLDRPVAAADLLAAADHVRGGPHLALPDATAAAAAVQAQPSGTVDDPVALAYDVLS
ncbi:winged helix-turn-helix domain-containing protein [Amycolatopsis sp. FU40]|uniref:BTAD domain-containing putative transcriptional regulator n=1 Tax=Amycolatopsis sp. FU40 TaxID=2914159 RepID=UPI001F02F4A2|nr:BTAD domain-containing putative transcriptional regulator [Amycolatopsis sp. FU40]UKD54553.1 winged helix-turn-helix domain-containing protein [Amycolatopsis sp. FU40]